MSGKLNQSLEEILKDKRSSATSATRGGRGGRPRRGAKPTQVAAPAGGIKKNIKPARGAVKQPPARGAKGSRGSMIQIGNLVSITSAPLCSILVANLLFYSPETSPRTRSRYVIDEAVAASETCVDTYLPSRIMST